MLCHKLMRLYTGIMMVMCVLYPIVSAFSELTTDDTGVTGAEDIPLVLGDPLSDSQKAEMITRAENTKGCTCSSSMLSCVCCRKLIRLTCVTIDGNLDTASVDVLAVWGTAVLANQTISVQNPPPFCQGVLFIVQACVVVSQISLSASGLGGCVRFELNILTFTIFKSPDACFFRDTGDEQAGAALADGGTTVTVRTGGWPYDSNVDYGRENLNIL